MEFIFFLSLAALYSLAFAFILALIGHGKEPPLA